MDVRNGKVEEDKSGGKIYFTSCEVAVSAAQCGNNLVMVLA